MSTTRWKHIVVAIADPFRKEQLALDKAEAIAARGGARLTLLNTFMLPQPTPDTMLGLVEQNIAVSKQDRLHRLERLAAPLRRRGIKVNCAVEWDYPIQDAIVRYVLQHKPSLLMAGSHRHGQLARWLLANTDWELIRNCPCPVWFVRNGRLTKAPKVLVAVDPRHTHDKPARLDDRLLMTGKTVVDQLDGQVVLAHAYEVPLTTAPGTLMEPIRIPLPASSARAFIAATTRRVNRLGAKHGIPVKARYVRAGDAIHMLTILAKEYRADVLVMGAVSRTLLKRPFIGNTAEKVIDQVDCDVLVVKPPKFKSPVPRTRPKIS